MINFPDTPVNGQTFSAAGCLYTFQSSPTPLWLPSTSSLGNVVISDTPPATPAVGQCWFDSVGAQEYIWMNDGTSTQWIPITNQPGPQTGYQAGTGLALNTGTTPTTIALTTPVSVANGGTGAATSAQAATNLAVVPRTGRANVISGGHSAAATGVTGSGVMGGFAVPLTPQITGMVFTICTGWLTLSATGGAFVAISYGTGTAPAQGVAMTGTAAGNGIQSQVVGTGVPFTVCGLVGPLTLSTAYWFDIYYGVAAPGYTNAINGGTQLIAIEL